MNGEQQRAASFAKLGSQFRSAGAFTLIELLVVIAVIAILAALVFPVTGAVNRAKSKSKARAELMQLQSAIENYKTKLGHYPPDNPGNPSLHQLYFELLGTTNSGSTTSPFYITLDGSARLAGASLSSVFGAGVAGFVNCTQPGGGDEGKFATPFLRDLKPGQVAADQRGSVPAGQIADFIVCSVPTPDRGVVGYLGARTLTPFFYNASTPTNNPNTYDLWVDVMISGKTNRISNWSQTAIVLP